MHPIGNLDPDDIPVACDENFNNLNVRLSVLESEFTHVTNWCSEAKDSLANIEEMVTELKDCVKPRLAEHGIRIGNVEAQLDGIKKVPVAKSNGDNGNGNGISFFSKKMFILIIVIAAVAGPVGDKIFTLLFKFFGIN
jgi:hypothetical protein